MQLQNYSNERIIRDLARARGNERANLTSILRLIGEVERRRLYAELGYPSLYQYCIDVLGYSEDEAYLRIGVARAGRRFPLILDMIERGELHLSGAAKCVPQLTPEDYGEILADAAHKTKREIEEMLAARFPQEDQPDSILPVRGTAQRHSVHPTAEDRFAICFTASRRVCELIERAKELSSHRRPRPGFEAVVEAALEAYVEKLEKQKFKTTPRPQKPRASKSKDPRHVPAHVVREVYQRDGRRCTYTSDDGHRCNERHLLELDHIDPVGRGGKPVASNLRLRCHTHNQLTARQDFDEEYVSLRAAGFRPVRRSPAERIAANRAALQAIRPLGTDPIEFPLSARLRSTRSGPRSSDQAREAVPTR